MRILIIFYIVFFIAITIIVGRAQLPIDRSSANPTITETPTTPIATSTEKVITNAVLETENEATSSLITTPTIQPQTKTEPVSTGVKEEPEAITKNPEPVVTKPTPTGKSNELVRKAIVNILCSAKNQTLSSISGSGVIIDPRGIILTNAHIAQYLLLTNYLGEDFLSCVIRTGSPAYPRYRVELVYVSPSWIMKNSTIITSDNPTGTGEYDYAFLRISEAIDKSPLPQFDFLIMDQSETKLNQDVVLAGYPASFLGSIAVERNLYLLSALSTVFDIYTFGKDNTPDLISVGSSVLAQQGASGGAVASNEGTLLGIIVTTTDEAQTAERDLRAVTLTHIERAFQKETGSTIETLLEGDIVETAKNFEKTISPILRDKLISALKSE